MAVNKSQALKDFLIAKRQEVSPSIMSAPVWAMQKAGKRIYNTHRNRHWRRTDFGKQYRKLVKKGIIKE
ncbi:MAG: hypothetical protein DRO04_02225 [Candidatus Iainarchaeum archaeon]|uniref:50S ribosomal protein L39e n=1 Tax=Candidatus Iainarchaeum sp. TaxID=3101447 RepID=A0A497JHF4_9ARCH|nr:MAG: hypothetical protein DRO04_02225 [Candidatus Diapherotrites archaeon]